ncbi:MAG: hypothetical protein KDH88_12305 [Chromatiales bacterium]|nr:hypothetical protein [Chromatiales bacterium]
MQSARRVGWGWDIELAVAIAMVCIGLLLLSDARGANEGRKGVQMSWRAGQDAFNQAAEHFLNEKLRYWKALALVVGFAAAIGAATLGVDMYNLHGEIEENRAELDEKGVSSLRDKLKVLIAQAGRFGNVTGNLAAIRRNFMLAFDDAETRKMLGKTPEQAHWIVAETEVLLQGLTARHQLAMKNFFESKDSEEFGRNRDRLNQVSRDLESFSAWYARINDKRAGEGDRVDAFRTEFTEGDIIALYRIISETRSDRSRYQRTPIELWRMVEQAHQRLVNDEFMNLADKPPVTLDDERLSAIAEAYRTYWNGRLAQLKAATAFLLTRHCARFGRDERVPLPCEQVWEDLGLPINPEHEPKADRKNEQHLVAILIQRLEGAIEDLGRLERGPMDKPNVIVTLKAALYYTQGTIHYHSKNYRDARKALIEAIKIARDKQGFAYTRAYNLLAWMYGEGNDELTDDSVFSNRQYDAIHYASLALAAAVPDTSEYNEYLDTYIQVLTNAKVWYWATIIAGDAVRTAYDRGGKSEQCKYFVGGESRIDQAIDYFVLLSEQNPSNVSGDVLFKLGHLIYMRGVNASLCSAERQAVDTRKADSACAMKFFEKASVCADAGIRNDIGRLLAGSRLVKTDKPSEDCPHQMDFMVKTTTCDQAPAGSSRTGGAGYDAVVNELGTDLDIVREHFPARHLQAYLLNNEAWNNVSKVWWNNEDNRCRCADANEQAYDLAKRELAMDAAVKLGWNDVRYSLHTLAVWSLCAPPNDEPLVAWRDLGKSIAKWQDCDGKGKDEIWNSLVNKARTLPGMVDRPCDSLPE